MSIKDIDKKYPDFFRNTVLPEKACNQEIEVYRFCVEGIIDRRAFDSSYADKHITGANRALDIKPDSKDPKHYATSVYHDVNDVIMRQASFTNRKPMTIVAKGITEKSCGPCAISSHWRMCNTSHVDWWIYEDAHPECFFCEVNYNE